jgi:hypothetical protein
MKKWIALMAAVSMWFVGPAHAAAQTSDDALAGSADQQPGLRKLLSDRPFFGTQPVLTLGGNYVNTPREDFEQFGIWSQPLTLDQMDGVIGELSFGEARKQGEWQLTFRYRLMTMDSEWQAIADSNAGLTLSDRRSQVLKASYNLRDWWKLGIAAVLEDKSGADPAADPFIFGLSGRQGLGFQVDTSLKF